MTTAADHGTDTPTHSLEWQIAQFARSQAEHRDHYQREAAKCRTEGDNLNAQCWQERANTYKDVLQALHIWTYGQHGQTP